MALKLGKCRLCLKLGDFYSIFTVDNSLQLAEMVMECTRVKIYEGDGLPDKVCSECIQKLSGAYIFKQQCERADEELRRNYVPPPGFNVPAPNRQSSDSAFSNHTDLSKPSSSIEGKTPTSRTRKRSRESVDNASTSSRSQDFRPTNSKVEEIRNFHKRPRQQSPNTSIMESDYEDNSISHFSAETDSDEPLLRENQCKTCGKQFKSLRSLTNHLRIHSKKDSLGENAVVDIPKNNIEDAADVEDKLSCEKCGKTFKLKIMLKRHHDTCLKQPQKSPQKELLVTLEPIDAVQSNKIDCEMCTTKFKTIENLEKHMRVVHAAVLNRELYKSRLDSKKTSVPCIFCDKPFDDYYIHTAHLGTCPRRYETNTFQCPLCHKVTYKKSSYFLHLKNTHFEPRCSPTTKPATELNKPDFFECRMCKEKLASEELLITHLAAHMSNIDNTADIADEESRASTVEDSTSVHSEYSCSVKVGPLSCKYCNKPFKYKRALATHEQLHCQSMVEVKTEPPDKDASTSYLTQKYKDTESDSSQNEDDNTCDICEKHFSYKRLLIQHKKTKHNMSSGTKRAKINLKDCLVRCLICDVEMKVSAIIEHNQKHTSVNIKPRNLYTCVECNEKFKSCSSLANHIKIVHRLKQQTPKQFDGDLADFCEVVVTKAEPLDQVQSHNGFDEVPGNQAGTPLVNLTGFTCPICSKQMPTLLSLKRHVNWHSNVGNNIEKKIECFVCKETFRFQCHYKLHMREHYKDTNLDPKLLTCSICNRRSKHLRAAQMHMNYHKQTRFKNKDYQCSICKRVFQHRKVYLSHMAIHFKRGESIQNTIVGSELPNTADRTAFDGSHTCQYCGKVCDSENSLKHHISWHKSKTSLYGARHECHICHLQFTNKKRQELHTRTHYEDDNGPYKCNICGKGFIDEEYYRKHLKGHNFDHQSHKKRIERLRKDKVKCPICIRYYPDLVKLIRHLRLTHPESKMIKVDPDAPPQPYHSCKMCAKVFLDERRLQAHEERHLRKREFYKCKFCNKNSMSLKLHRIHIKSHLTQKYTDNPLQCTQCEERFVKGYDLHHHLRDAHGINETWIAERKARTLDGPLQEFQCSVCFKVLATKGNFERHIDYHNSLRCNYCFEYFSTLKFLEGHLAFSCDKRKLIGYTEVHLRKVKCHICYKAFHLQVKLDCHLRTQHGIKVSKEASESQKETVCDYCFRVFENEDALTTHKIYHRTVGYFGCIYCKKKFNTLTLYRKHKNHHFAQLNVDNPTKCEHCDETFVAFREMIYHMKDVHGDDKEWIVMPKESIEETCKICNKTFYNLHKHLTYHEENRCKKCGEYFYSRNDFDNHLCTIDSDDEVENNETDLRAKYEECRFCFKPMTKKNKKLHDKIHNVSGAISCRFCSLKFKTMDAFNIHAFSHRSRKYTQKPLKCRKCGEKFIKYGPFIKHMKGVHKMSQKTHYRAVVKAERCVVCGDMFPNLHNHYRAHLSNQCQLCRKYFTSVKVFSHHQCDKEDTDPSKVFVCDEDLNALIKSYIPRDERGNEQKYYGYSEDEDDEEYTTPTFKGFENDESQNSVESSHTIGQSPIISDVLSLSQIKDDINENGGVATNVVNLIDEDSVDANFAEIKYPTITIDD